MSTPTPSLERRAETLEHAQRHWRQRRLEANRAAGIAVSVALMREAGTPGSTVARAVAARLSWQVYDYELLQHIAEEHGLRLSLLESVDERHKGWLTECVEAFGSVPTISENTYVRHLVETVLSLGSIGHCVIVGRGSAFILPGVQTLRVRLVGNLDDRIEGAAQRRGLARKDAARWVEQTERDRIRFARDHFLKDITDPHHYDLLLNTSRWSVDECAEFISDSVRRLEARLARP